MISTFSESEQKNNVIDFDYKEFDKSKYLNISPYNSPLPPSLHLSSDEDEYSEYETLSKQYSLESITSIMSNEVKDDDNRDNISEVSYINLIKNYVKENIEISKTLKNFNTVLLIFKFSNENDQFKLDFYLNKTEFYYCKKSDVMNKEDIRSYSLLRV